MVENHYVIDGFGWDTWWYWVKIENKVFNVFKWDKRNKEQQVINELIKINLTTVKFIIKVYHNRSITTTSIIYTPHKKFLHQNNSPLTSYPKNTIRHNMLLYILEAILIAFLSMSLIIYYSHKSTAYYARFLVFITFFICLVSFMILPIDIYENSKI